MSLIFLRERPKMFVSGIVPAVRHAGIDCDGQHEEDKCGRPLGLAFTQSGKLLGTDISFLEYALCTVRYPK
jgi:hypothetical protein